MPLGYEELRQRADTCCNDPMTPDHEPDAVREQSPPYAPPPETQWLIDELYREELREARAMTPEQIRRTGPKI